ncbi:MAG: hypothetical protein AAF408_20205, partial [Pseudomonadota bacterium]
MINRLFLLLTFCVTVPTLASAKMSDVTCDDSARMLSMLTEVLGAERQGMGLRDPETMLEESCCLVWLAELECFRLQSLVADPE